jgi:hypothetical protein
MRGVRLSKIFPSYPLQLASPRKGSVRIASRRPYVDLPYAFWVIMGRVVDELDKSKDLQETFGKTTERLYSDEEVRKATTFNGACLGTILLVVGPPWSEKPLLKLKVNWKLFLQYLEERAQELASKVEADGSTIRELYNEVEGNYFRLAGLRFIPDPRVARFNELSLERFKKLLRELGEEREIRRALSALKKLVSTARSAGPPGLGLWMLQLEADFHAVEACLENMDILSCYFYLRNALENLVKLIVYSDIAKEFSAPDEVLMSLFFYDRVAEGRCGSIRQLVKNYVNKIHKHVASSEARSEELYQVMVEKRLPKLYVDRQCLKEFQERYGIEAPIVNFWRACSEVMHNRSPLPFFSLLEVKAFKHFLRRYSERFASVLKAFLPSIAEAPSGEGEEPPARLRLSERAWKALHQLSAQREREVRELLGSMIKDEALRKALFFDLLTLASIFHLVCPSLRHIKSGEFSIEDVEYFIAKIRPLSRFPFNQLSMRDLVCKFREALRALEEAMMPKLEELSPELSRLSEEGRGAVASYLLAMELPKLLALGKP